MKFLKLLVPVTNQSTCMKALWRNKMGSLEPDSDEGTSPARGILAIGIFRTVSSDELSDNS